MWRFWLEIPKVGPMSMRLLFFMHSEHKHIILLFAFLASEALVHAIFYLHDCCAWSIAPGVSLPSWYTGFCYKRTPNKISDDFLFRFPLISKEITNDISMKNANLILWNIYAFPICPFVNEACVPLSSGNTWHVHTLVSNWNIQFFCYMIFFL